MKPFISIFFGFCWNCQTSSYFVTISRVITTWRGSCFTKVVFYKKLFFNIVVLYFYSNSLKNTYEGIPFREVVGLQPVNLLCKSYSVNLRIQSESGKIRTQYLDTFHAVTNFLTNSSLWPLQHKNSNKRRKRQRYFAYHINSLFFCIHRWHLIGFKPKPLFFQVITSTLPKVMKQTVTT